MLYNRPEQEIDLGTMRVKDLLHKSAGSEEGLE
jgi:hypothetical protein